MTAPASAPVRPAQVPAVAGWLDRRSRPAPALRLSGLVLAYTALTILFTWPFATHLSEKVLNASDPVESIWRLGWAQEQLLHAPWRLFAGNTFYPYPRSYLFDELLVGPALLTLPVRLVWHNPVAVYNVAVLASCVLSALAMYALARRLGCGAAAAFAAGLIYAFAPHHFVHFTSGHLTLLSGQYFPLVVLLLDRLFAAPSWRDAFLLAGALALQALSSQYYAIYLVFVVLGFLAVRLVQATLRRRLPRWGVWARLLVAGGLAALVVLPFAGARKSCQNRETPFGFGAIRRRLTAIRGCWCGTRECGSRALTVERPPLTTLARTPLSPSAMRACSATTGSPVPRRRRRSGPRI